MSELILERLIIACIELAIVFSIALVIEQFTKIRSPRFRTFLWMLVLVKPLLTLLFGAPFQVIEIKSPETLRQQKIEKKHPALDIQSRYNYPEAAVAVKREDIEASLSGTTQKPDAPEQVIPPTPGQSFFSRKIRPLLSVKNIPGMLLIFWNTGLFIMGFFLYMGWRLLKKAVHKSRPVGDSMTINILKNQAKALGLKKSPDLRISDETSSPALVGLFRTCLLLPEWMIERCDRDEIQWAIRHELTHYKRKDHFLVALKRIITTLFFFHPLAWYAAIKWEVAMEQACDRDMINNEEDARNYARVLFHFIDTVRKEKRIKYAEGLFATRTQIGQRIALLLKTGARVPNKLTLRDMLTLSLIFVMTVSLGINLTEGEISLESIFSEKTRNDSSRSPLVRVLYIIPEGREPYDDYEERLDYLFSKMRTYFRDNMAAAGYLDADGEGKTFNYETDSSGKLLIHLIDHREDGNFPDAERKVDLYQENIGKSVSEDIKIYLPPDFMRNAIAVAVVNQTEITSEHMLGYNHNNAWPRDDPGGGAICYLTDHIFGNHINYNMPDPPRVFHALGKNDREQMSIFRDSRFTNIISINTPYPDTAPAYWENGELSHSSNVRVWEYSSRHIGLFAQTLGKAFHMDLCYNRGKDWKNGRSEDANVMGSGCMCIFAGLFPGSHFDAKEMLPRVDNPPANFARAPVINPIQHLGLDRHPFFNPDFVRTDTIPPVITGLDAWHDPENDIVTVEISTQDRPGEDPAGISHISLLMDWKLQETVIVEPSRSFDALTLQIPFEVGDEERPWNWLENDAFSRRLHHIRVEVMDRQGNVSDFDQSMIYISSVDHRVRDWLVWSEYFDTYHIAGSNTSYRDMLLYPYMNEADEEIQPGIHEGRGGHSWRPFSMGDLLPVTAKSKTLFRNDTTSLINRVCYAAVFIESETSRDIVLRAGYNDFIRIILNNTEIYTSENFESGPNLFNQDDFLKIDVSLKPGKNLLLIKLLNVYHESGVHVWFEEKDGSPVDVKYVLN